MQNATALTIPQDRIISKALPSVRDVLRLALSIGASSASCESSFSTLARVLTDYRRSVLHGSLARLVLLAFEQDLTSHVCKDKDGLLRMFDSMAHRRLQLF